MFEHGYPTKLVREETPAQVLAEVLDERGTQALLDELARLRKALAIYAERENWEIYACPLWSPSWEALKLPTPAGLAGTEREDAVFVAGFRAGYAYVDGEMPFQSEVDDSLARWVEGGRKTHRDEEEGRDG